MDKTRYRLLAVELNAEESSNVRGVLDEHGRDDFDIIPTRAADLPETLAEPLPFDLALVGAEVGGGGPVSALVELRRRTPLLPIVMIVSDPNSGAGPDVVAAGTATVLWIGSVHHESFHRTLSTVVERDRFEALGGVPAQRGPAAREMHQLRAACGPAPLTTTQKSLGSRSLKSAASKSFEDMTRRYEGLLERALTARTRDIEPGIAEELHVLADRLGALNVGPRDIIELHRVALTNKLRDLSGPKAEAFIDEGRMLMIQLMGYVLSYYRALTWGAPRPQQLLQKRLLDPETRKTEKKDGRT